MRKKCAISVLVTLLASSLFGGCEWLVSNHFSESQIERKLCLEKPIPTVTIPSGQAEIGSDQGYPEESPERSVEIAAFDMDATEVTNEEFARFVDETGYVTSAERIQPKFETSGAAVFTPPDATNPSWWRFDEGANWRHPDGPESSIEGRELDPVVQVSHEDAKAYAGWAGRALPSEA